MKKKLVFGLILSVIIVIVAVFGMFSYMSLNKWDIRCVLVECKPVRIVGDEQ